MHKIESPQRCAVFGVNGYLGSHLASSLRSAGHDVQGYGCRTTSHSGRHPDILLDVVNSDHWKHFKVDVDLIFFFAGVTGTHQGFEQAPHYLDVNEGGLLRLIEQVRLSGRKPVIVFPSTRLVYGGSAMPIEEDAYKVPKCIYAINKLACENILSAYQNAFDIPYYIFRICLPYGTLLDPSSAYGTIGLFSRMAQAGKNISLYGDGRQRRTLTHVEDICTQIIDITLSRNAEPRIFNICGEDYSLKEAAELIALRYGVSVEYSPWPEADLRLETGSTVFDDSRIRTALPSLVLLHSFSSWVGEQGR
jgi:UDP-glucose 4-epimerase